MARKKSQPQPEQISEEESSFAETKQTEEEEQEAPSEDSSESEKSEDVAEESSEESSSEEKVAEKTKAKPKVEREDPFASLNMPPPIGDDYESSEDQSDSDSEEQRRRGPAISALDANKNAGKKDQKKGSQLSKKSESFLASIGAGFDSEDDVPIQKTPTLNNKTNIFGDFNDDPTNGLNNPYTTQLSESPMIGGRISASSGAQGVIGRATTPKIFAQASQFPTCTQLKCWKWENGVPVSIGIIDSQADEADFIREFFDDMPKKGDGKIRYSFRPVDINGQELGSEIAFYISETHKEIKKRKRMQEEEEESSSEADSNDLFSNLLGNNRRGTLNRRPEYQQEKSVLSEADKMWSRMVTDTKEQTDSLRTSLETERERLRRLEEERAQERVDLAVNTAQGVQSLSNQMLEAEQKRAQLALAQQQQQTEVMMNSLSQIFSQQQSMTTLQMQRQQQADQLRVEQERQRAERERLDLEERRRRDREEYEERRHREQREMELKWKELEEQRRWEREQLRIQLEKEKQEFEQRRLEEQRKWEREMELNRMRMEQERLENERKITREREELLMKMKIEKDDLERKERREKEDREREENRRKEELAIRQKQMDIQAQRDKEHQERMLQMAMTEREQQREALERKIQLEKEARDAEERERNRRHEMMMKELEQTRQRDREHSERMFLLQQKEIDVKGVNSLDTLLPKASKFLSQFGLEPVDVLRSVLGAGEVGGEDDDDDDRNTKSGGWMDNLPKILGLVGDVMKVATAGGLGGQAAMPQQPMPMLTQDPNLQNLMYQQQMVQEQLRQQSTRQPNFDNFYPPPPQQQQKRRPAEKKQSDDYELNIPEEVVTEEIVEEIVDTNTIASNAGMDMPSQRNARKALRNLVKKMRSASEDKWEELVTSAIMSEIAIFTYIVAVNAKVAITEAGADPDLCSRIIKALKESSKLKETLGMFSMSINDIPFGE